MDDSKRNNLIAQRNTPMKRLGLGHKRISSPLADKSEKKIRISEHGKEPDISSQSVGVEIHKEDSPLPSTDNVTGEELESTDEAVLDAVKVRISQKQEQLKAHKIGNDLQELKSLCQIWKDGCKMAFLDLIELLKKKHSKSISNKKLLQELGICNIMYDHFENDSELFVSDEEDSTGSSI